MATYISISHYRGGNTGAVALTSRGDAKSIDINHANRGQQVRVADEEVSATELAELLGFRAVGNVDDTLVVYFYSLS